MARPGSAAERARIAAEDRAAEAAADREMAARDDAWRASPAGRARAAEDLRSHRAARIGAMADVMVRMADHGGCSTFDLQRSGFSAVEIRAYREPALQRARSLRPGMNLEAA